LKRQQERELKMKISKAPEVAAQVQRENQIRMEKLVTELKHPSEAGRQKAEEMLEHDGPFSKVRALHEAAERLAAAEMPDLAHELHRRAEQMEMEIHKRFEHEHTAGPSNRELAEQIEQLRHEVRILTKRVEQLQHQE